MKSSAAKNILALLLLTFILLPIFTSAQLVSVWPGGPPAIDLWTLFANILRAVWIIFTFIAVIAFVVSGVLFLSAQGNPEKIKIARQAVIWGSVGIIVGILAFSIIGIIESALV